MDKLISVEKNKVFTSEILINKSRFLCFAKHIENKEEAEEFLNEIRKKYADARHICYAYRLKNTSKASDDGEPGGTAGRPMLLVLEKQNLYDIIAVVVRYFGGIKLGTSGLIVAYREAAREAITAGNIIECHEMATVSFTYPYLSMNEVMRVVKDTGVKIIAQEFDNSCAMDLSIRADYRGNLVDRLGDIDGVTFRY